MGSTAEYNRQWRANNREHYRKWCRDNYADNSKKKLKRNKAWRDAHPEKVKTGRRTYMFGEGAQAHFDAQKTVQQNCCAICHKPFGSTKDTHQDHDHDNNKLRGLLCSRCNPALGGFLDSPELLRAAAIYIEEWRVHHGG